MAYQAALKAEAEKIIRFTATQDPASLAAGTQRTDTHTVPGVRFQDSDLALIDTVVNVLPPASFNGGLVVQSARVTADNTIQVILFNTTAGALDAAAGTWEYLIARF